MKSCPSGGTNFIGKSWRFRFYGVARADGFIAFAPGLAAANDGMASDAHYQLERMQESSFWFRSPNTLAVELPNRHFPDARTVLEVGCGTGYVPKGLQNSRPCLRLFGSEIYVNGLPCRSRRLPFDCFRSHVLIYPWHCL